MKRYIISRYILLVMVLLSVPAVLHARKSTYNRLEHHDFIYLAPSIGYMSLMDTTQSSALTSQQTMGSAFQLGAGYRMYHNHFLLQVGLNVKYGENRVEGDELTVSLPQVATLKNHYDLIHSGEVQVPLQIGAEVRRFYFLVGPKIGFNFYGDVRPFADPESGNEHLPIVQHIDKEAFRYTYNLNAAVEMGWRLGEVFYGHGADVPQPSTRYYLGVFAEGGALCRTVPEGRTTYYEPATAEVDGQTKLAVGMYPIYSLNDFKNTRFIHNYTVGVKLTILFELDSDKYCVLCKDHKKVNFSW